MTLKGAITTLAFASVTLIATPALAAIEAFDASSLEPSFDKYREIDFENLQLGGTPPDPGGPTVTSVRIRGVTFNDPNGLQTGFCSSPTCSPDPDNPEDGNNVLFLNLGANIYFSSSPKLVVLDIQGMGDNPFDLLVTDSSGHTLTVNSQGVLFGRTLLGLRADDGVQRIDVVSVGGTGGPLVLARALFSQSGH